MLIRVLLAGQTYIDILHLIYTVAKSCLSNKLFIAEILYIERLAGIIHLQIHPN